jgi:hypothetical protein
VHEGTPHGNPSLLNYFKIISMQSPEFSYLSTYFFRIFKPESNDRALWQTRELADSRKLGKQPVLLNKEVRALT